MAAATPAKKIQLRPDFFRGQHSTDESPSAKKSTRIPFIGRPRKKSTQSDILPSVATAQVTQSRTSVATVGSRSNFDNAGDGLASPPLASTSQQSLKATSNSTSLGSRLAAHFTPRTSLRRFQSRRSQPSLHSPGELSDYTSDSLAPPKSGPRSPSIDSTSSRLSRSSTPRATQTIRDPLDSSRLPAQPTITVSRPPPLDYDLDNLDEYSDLFTKPRRKIKPKPVPINTRPLKYTEDHHSYAPLARSSSPPSALTFSREPHAGGQIANSHKPFAPDADSTSISGNPIPSSRALATGRRDSSLLGMLVILIQQKTQRQCR
ncbi:hypothetical protein D9757_001665 [Collybiopsis confluens]|uniref:Uncharacterized protein n=1 Tax=Collybiopsis confluens TaxID=2823264 RepID=A0A8H5HYX0_9AGAR|nr:hypothetical protein D9757_001665 [Collybiopsis confluens]